MMRRFILFIVAYAAAETSCPRKLLSDHYKELGCAPKFENGEECPTSYDCTVHDERDKTKCYHQGKSYNDGEEIGDLISACSAACRCFKMEPNTEPTITCANIECPEHFNPRPGPNCWSVYDHESCCQKSSICRQKGEAHPPIECKHGNATYYDGQRFYPPEEPCKQCICMKNYKGVVEEPFCKEIQCNTQLHNLNRINEGCVPVYFGDSGCCPIDWQCPDKEDKIREARTKDQLKTTEACKFGKLVLQPGDVLEQPSANSNVKCSCKLPPLLTCISRPTYLNNK